jgi:putative membrane protein
MLCMRMVALFVLLTVGLPALLMAHAGGVVTPQEIWTAWTLDPCIVASVIVPGWLYFFGVLRLWERAGYGRGVRKWQAGCFGAGIFAMFVALISPLDSLGGALFSAHMVQHVVLMMVAAPLLALGHPLVAFAWALPKSWLPWIAAWQRMPGIQATWQTTVNPIVAWLVHAAAIWVWHIPLLYEATLRSELVHLAQHASFFGTAMLFWWAAFEFGKRQRLRYGLGAVYVFTTAMHSSILSALLTFSLVIWYPIYADRTAAWGLTPLEDQQLGGLLMWIPAGIIYLVAAVALLGAGLGLGDRASEGHAAPRFRPVPQPFGSSASSTGAGGGA